MECLFGRMMIGMERSWDIPAYSLTNELES